MQCLEVWGGNQATNNGVVMPGLDAWVFSRPYEDDDAGGDIHYVSSCATGRIIRVLVADVSGHGSQVAKVAGSLRNLMRRYVNFVDQTRVVRGLNTEFASLAEQGSFATAVVATFWAPTDNLVITNAGHPRPLWYRARNRAWEYLDQRAPSSSAGPSNIPLGIAEPTLYDEVSIHLGPGDLVLIYTDSLLEARDRDGRLLGEAGLRDLVGQFDPANPDELIRSLLTRLEAISGRPPDDDVTALLLRPNALKPRGSILTGLKAGLFMTGAFLGSLRPGGQPFPWPELGLTNLAGAFVSRLNRRIGRKSTRG